MSTAKEAVFRAVPLMSVAAALFMLAVAPPAAAQTVCADSVQGRIAWDGAKNTSWTPANLAALCNGAETSTEPGLCFKRVKSGTVDFGGGTNWNPDNALRLCAGALNANARVTCFEGKIAQGIKWAAAIGQCEGTGASAVDPGSKGSVPTAKPGSSPVKVPPMKSGTIPTKSSTPPKKSSTPPAGPSATCTGTEDCDGDGVSFAADDCDDRDAARYPGAREIADFEGHDEDCNPATYGDLDADGDGFVDSRVCNGPNCGQDCDDTRPAVNPHAAELPNRRDDNCNGLVDDDLEGWWNPAP